MFEVRDLSFSYKGGRSILRDITFKVAPGSLCALVGASGSGKSTLLKLVAGILPGDGDSSSGSIQLGRNYSETSSLVRLGYVFQDFSLLPFLSVEQNVAWAQKKLLRHGRPSPLRTPLELLSIVGMKQWASEFPNKLSGGMQARVAIARALCNEPDLLLVDEAFSSLDIGWRISLYKTLDRLRHDFGVTVCFISHDIADVCQIAEQVVVLSGKGTIAGMMLRADVRSNEGAKRIRDLILVDHPVREIGQSRHE